jgi:hypothetical protein
VLPRGGRIVQGEEVRHGWVSRLDDALGAQLLDLRGIAGEPAAQDGGGSRRYALQGKLGFGGGH